ncbi:MAG: SpoVR family protein [Myxococcales bacterium]
MGDVVRAGNRIGVSDGQAQRSVYDRNVIKDQPTITIRTRRGLSLTGSCNHRVLLPNWESWRRLDEFGVGDRVAISGGANLWASEEMRVTWRPDDRIRWIGEFDPAVELTGATYRNVALAVGPQDWAKGSPHVRKLQYGRRKTIRIPEQLDIPFAQFCGYLIGDGHISRVKRELGLTAGDEPQAQAFSELAYELFGLLTRATLVENRWRVIVHSETLSDLLVEGLGFTTGPSAREKQLPKAILRSPKHVVAAFLRAYFDCDGYAGKQGVILSTSSEVMSEQVQLLLLNFGILSRRRPHKDGCWHVHVQGKSSEVFLREIGFGLDRKQAALNEYVTQRRWFKDEKWEDEIVSIEHGRADVYDISVEGTHRYAAAGFINHNSFWHSTIMTTKALKDHEIIDYADHHSGTMGTRPGAINPYKLGIELWRHIEERWNKGRFGKEYDECDDLRARRAWDKKLGLGRGKIFEVRKHYNDVTFIDEFLTADFAAEQKLFVYGFNEKGNRWEILDREFQKVKRKLLQQLTNFGQPIIEVVDGNFENRGELLLAHRHDGVDLRADYAKDTLVNLQAMWRRPVAIVTRMDGKGVLMRFDGRDHADRKVDY